MYKVMYVCDYCGKDMKNNPEFTVSYRSNSLAVFESKEWHYCHDCWEEVKTFFSTNKNVNDRYTPFSDCGCYTKDSLNTGMI